MVSFERKHCKYDMHIYFHASFLGIAFKSFIDDKDFTALSVCKKRSTCFVLLYKFLIMCNAFVFYPKKQDI